MQKPLLTCAFFLYGLGLFAQQSPATQQPAFPAANAYAKANISAKIIPSEANTWGYDILVDGKRFIHQPSKPGLPGNQGFASKEKAQKVADLMIQKIKRGEMPPGVSIEEMKKLNVL